jgi:hypothetical protein
MKLDLLNDSMKEYFYKDNVFTFEGCISIEEADEWVSPWRIDFNQLDFYPFLKDRVAHACSGIRLAFTTNSKNIVLRLSEPQDKFRFDLIVDGKLEESITLKVNDGTKDCFVKFKGLDSKQKSIEIWLDQSRALKLKSIYIDANAVIEKNPVSQKRWVHYGSSISHANEASSPINTWPAIVARKMNLNLCNLGVAGNCKIEPMMALMISRCRADLITLKLGINVDCGELTSRTFGPNIIGFIQIIREKHPSTPLVLISPIISPPREDKKQIETHLGLKEMRSTISEIVETCRRYGDKNIYYVDGLKIFGQDETKYLPDDLHPNSEGQPILAQHFIEEVF